MPRFKDEVIENKRKEAARVAVKKRWEEFRKLHPKYCGECNKLITVKYGSGLYCCKECMVAGRYKKECLVQSGRTLSDEHKRNLWKNRRIHPVGEIYPQKGSGYLLIKPAEHAHPVYYHIYVWEQVNGKKLRGYVIHHIDEDKSNNDISNLQMMTISEHAKLHNEIKRRRHL